MAEANHRNTRSMARDLVIAGDHSTIDHLDQVLALIQTNRDGFLAYLNRLDANDQYCVLTSMSERILMVDEKKNEMSEFLENTANNMGMQEKMKENEETWAKVSEFAQHARGDRDRKLQSLTAIKKIWPAADIASDFGELVERKVGSTTWRALQALSNAAIKNQLSYRDFKRHILMAQVDRLNDRTGKVGTRKTIGIEAQDINQAKVAILRGDKVDRKALELAITGKAYGVSQHGFLTHRSADGVVENHAIAYRSGHHIEYTDIRIDYGLYEDIAVNVANNGVDSYGERLRTVSPDSSESPAGAMDGSSSETDHNVDSLSSSSIGESDSDDNFAIDSDNARNEFGPESRATSSDNDSIVSVTVTKKSVHRCGCGIDVSDKYIGRLGARRYPGTEASLIKTWFRFKDHGVCHKHTQRTCGALGLNVKGLTRADLTTRLNAYHDATLKSRIGKLKTNLATYQWFHRGRRPARPADHLGPYKYIHNIDKKIVLTIGDQKRLCKYLNIDYNEWARVGSVNVDCFKWWETLRFANKEKYGDIRGRSIYDVVNDEFEMYHYHLREIGGKPNYGWLRNMFHALCQQVMRQDPVYYMMYVALRADQKTDLVSYPYYAKYQHKGDSTFFRHIDVNIPRMDDVRRGWYQIQGTVSLDDEQDDDCTEILPGMHNNFEAWAKSLVAREAKLGADIHYIGPEEFTAGDVEKFDTNWTAVPCKRLQVRITQPHLPHGAQGPAKRTRRTMLPWFVALQEDLQSLEITEGGTFDELNKAHRDLTSGPRSPSGHPNKYGDIPYAFPAAVKLTGLGALSEALVAQTPHDNPLVMAQKRTLFFGSNTERDHFIKDWRMNALREVVTLFEQVKKIEKQVFGEKSYWYRREHKITTLAPEYDPDPLIESD